MFILQGKKIPSGAFFILIQGYQKKYVIYGGGYVGKRVLLFLLNQGLKLQFFIDSDISKVGSYIEEYEVKQIEELKLLHKDTTIVIAGRFWKEIENEIKKIQTGFKNSLSGKHNFNRCNRSR